jgi:hypothetical protein
MRVVSGVVVLAACGSGGGAGPDAPANAAAQQFCVTETNRYRAMASKPAVTESPTLEAFATAGAMVDFSSSPHSHFMSTNGCPVQGNWMLSPGGDMSMLVGQCIAAFYAEGPGGGHYENMMGAYASLGCGIYQMGTGVTIVQDYGQ